MSDNISYNSFRLSAECPFFKRRRIGTFVRGGDFDSRYFVRNKNHFDAVVEWQKDVFSSICSNSEVFFRRYSWNDANGCFCFLYHVSSPCGDFFVQMLVSKEA